MIHQLWRECATTYDKLAVLSVPFFIIAAALGYGSLLAGCSTPTVTRTETVEVKVPVAVQPIAPADVPALPAPLPPRPKSLSAATDLLLARWCEAVAYFIKADPLLRISAGEERRAVPIFPECEEKR